MIRAMNLEPSKSLSKFEKLERKFFRILNGQFFTLVEINEEEGTSLKLTLNRYSDKFKPETKVIHIRKPATTNEFMTLISEIVELCCVERFSSCRNLEESVALMLITYFELDNSSPLSTSVTRWLNARTDVVGRRQPVYELGHDFLD